MNQTFDYGVLVDWEESVSSILAEVVEMYEDKEATQEGLFDVMNRLGGLRQEIQGVAYKGLKTEYRANEE